VPHDDPQQRPIRIGGEFPLQHRTPVLDPRDDRVAFGQPLPGGIERPVGVADLPIRPQHERAPTFNDLAEQQVTAPLEQAQSLRAPAAVLALDHLRAHPVSRENARQFGRWHERGQHRLALHELEEPEPARMDFDPSLDHQ